MLADEELRRGDALVLPCAVSPAGRPLCPKGPGRRRRPPDRPSAAGSAWLWLNLLRWRGDRLSDEQFLPFEMSNFCLLWLPWLPTKKR